MNKLLFISVIFAMLVFFPREMQNAIHLPEYTQEKVVVIDELPSIIKNKNRGDLASFMRAIAKMESNHDHHVVNRFGMMGKYQFSPKTLRSLGFDVTQEQFLADPELQDRAMIKFIKQNRRALRGIIRDYAGTHTIDGVNITESGILAGAHLAGVGGVLSYFRPDQHQHPQSDANGATVELYLKKFSGYTIPRI
jgi:hypothetical protein